MDIRVWLYSVVISCTVIICLEAKTFSLNEAIAAEAKERKPEAVVTIKDRRPKPEKTSERFSLNEVLSIPSTKRRKYKKTGPLFSLLQRKRLSPFKYRKAFEIKSPLKPRKLKRSPKLRSKRKYQESENDVDDAILDQKYIPLLKTIGMLFDNILGTDESSSEGRRTRKYKRNRYRNLFIENDIGTGCSCDETGSETESTEATAFVEAVTSTSAIPNDFEIAETTTTTTHNPTASNFGGIGLDTDIPVLFPRNSISYQRNRIGIGERSSPARDWGTEGHFTWHNGNNEHDTKLGKDSAITKNDDEITISTSRNSSSSNGPPRRGWRIGNNRGTSVSRDSSISEDETKTNEINGEDGWKFKEENKLETGRDETESSKSVPKHFRRLRGSISEDEINTVTNVRFDETDEKGEQHNNTSHKRILVRNGEDTTQNQKVRSRNETVILVGTPTSKQYGTIPTNKPSNKSSIVMIIDGYSVTRHKNGENKLSNEFTHIHS